MPFVLYTCIPFFSYHQCCIPATTPESQRWCEAHLLGSGFARNFVRDNSEDDDNNLADVFTFVWMACWLSLPPRYTYLPYAHDSTHMWVLCGNSDQTECNHSYTIHRHVCTADVMNPMWLTDARPDASGESTDLPPWKRHRQSAHVLRPALQESCCHMIAKPHAHTRGPKTPRELSHRFILKVMYLSKWWFQKTWIIAELRLTKNVTYGFRVESVYTNSSMGVSLFKNTCILVKMLLGSALIRYSDIKHLNHVSATSPRGDMLLNALAEVQLVRNLIGDQNIATFLNILYDNKLTEPQAKRSGWVPPMCVPQLLQQEQTQRAPGAAFTSNYRWKWYQYQKVLV